MVRFHKSTLNNFVFTRISFVGGWWTQPANWKKNTFIAGIGAVLINSLAFYIGSQIEERDTPPDRWIPSMLVCNFIISIFRWAKEFKTGKYKDLKFDDDMEDKK
ncbi:hypothetical protein G9A89_023202 [Geosiphon pyriformis]|nr:hypothetical protein G9A89_023202 [Geosiphon pyriformis]